MNSKQALQELKRGVVDIIQEQDLLDRLAEQRPLRIKLGVDPTAPDIHLGHTVVLNKLKQFQDLGHHIMFLIGDYTAQIGDPSGKSKTRPPLDAETILQNARTYQEQVFKILDPQKTKVFYNSEWMANKSAADLIRLASSQTVARMLERDDFHKRYKNGQPIAIHEFLYPLLQGQDSVEMQADVELGGTDQTFNLLMGRELQKQAGLKPQVVITLPLLEGLDGVRKMSKSYDNYIGVTDSIDDMFGKVMSISDELMWRYFELLSFKPLAEVQAYKKEIAAGANPRDYKVKLAIEIVDRFHGEGCGVTALHNFEARFQQHQIPDDLPVIELPTEDGELGILYLLKRADLVASTSEATRMIKQGAVKIDGEKIADPKLMLSQGSCHVYQVGKRKFAKVKLV